MTMSRPVWKGRGLFLLLLLAGGLTAGAAVAWEAARAGRAQRATVEAVLGDYAEFAAWQYARAMRQQVDSTLDKTLAALSSAERHVGLADVFSARAATEADQCGCGTPSPEVRSFFHIEDGQWSIAGAAIAADVQALVSLRNHRAGRMATPFEMRIGGDHVIAWRQEHEQHRPVTHGFVASVALLRPALRNAATAAPLLPPTLLQRAGAITPVAIDVRDATGAALDDAAVADRTFARSTNGDPRLGHLTITAALNPATASSLVIGGLPESRLPFLYGSMAVTIALIGIAILQVRRELALARMRSDFVSGVSHELRTPLAQIRMFAETLSLGRVRNAEESRRSIEIILQESQRLSQLVDNVLAFSRADRQALELQPRTIEVRPLIEDLVETLQPLARSRQATLRLLMDASVTAVVDAGAVRQILLNLVDNALKYGPSGQTVTIVAACRGPILLLAVEDEGPGIPAADVAKIWAPFWRGSGSAQGGSGIGLAIVTDLVSRHHGTVRVERAPGGGARFEVTLREPAAAGRVA